MNQTSRPRAVIFDWDNTLIDSWPTIEAALNATLIAMGQAPWGRAEIKQRVALSLRDAFPALFGARWPEARDIFYREYEAIHLSYLTPLPGAADLLEWLAAAGVGLAVVSNKNGSLLRKEAAQLGWSHYFRKLVGAQDALTDKPTAAPVVMVLEALNQPAGPHIWFVGDTAVDMECAHNSQCLPILLREDPWREGEFALHPPHRHLLRCSDLRAMIEQLVVPIASN